MPRSIFACTYDNCSAIFRHSERYDAHLRMHSGERPYICVYDNCDKSYTRLSHLKRHEDSHESTFSCTVPGCAKILSSKGCLERHINIMHLKKKPKTYKCSECDQEFNKRSWLQRHIYTHTGIKTNVCPLPECGKAFSMPSRLKAHMKCHEGYPCKYPNCDEVFFKWTLYRRHVKDVHKSSFKCPICDKEFSHLCNLKHHSLIHKDDREVFRCTVPKCVRVYQAKRHLSEHLKMFHKERPFPCPEENCRRFYKSEETLSKHARYHHKPRQQKEKPDFAAILAGCEKGTIKDLNPHLSSTTAEHISSTTFEDSLPCSSTGSGQSTYISNTTSEQSSSTSEQPTQSSSATSEQFTQCSSTLEQSTQSSSTLEQSTHFSNTTSEELAIEPESSIIDTSKAEESNIVDLANSMKPLVVPLKPSTVCHTEPIWNCKDMVVGTITWPIYA